MIVASADLSNSDKTDGFLKKTHSFKKGDFSGAFFQAGVSELSMACICIGMSLHGGVIAACGTFFVFSDYMKPAVRMAALMEQPVKFIWTHDAFRVGEDGPTHEPVEQEAQIRLMEKLKNHKGHNSMLVLRPAERFTKGAVKGKTGSMTALPIIETQAGDVTAFVPTNVISITDGQIFLETDLFNAGIRPAINPGISVSRVGGAAQTKVIKKLGGGVRLALAQYRELAAFAQFASDLDEATRKQLERGRIVTELMKQDQYQPLQVWEEALVLFAINIGAYDDVEVKDALKVEAAMQDYMKINHADLIERIEQQKALSKEDEQLLTEAVKEFKKSGAF